MVTISNMTMIPKGVRMRNSPFITVIFCGTNLTRLPDDLGQAWDHAFTFFFELSPGLKELPASVSEWQVSALSLSSNGIEFIPKGTRFGDSVSALSLGFNPVRSIPSSIMELPSLTFIDARGTDISELPAPTSIGQGSSSGGDGGMTPPKVVEAAGSPMCERMLQPPAPGESGGGSEPQTIVNCEDPLTVRTWYPLSQSFKYFAMTSE
ncbi:hypothetical protein Poli38472_014717 [Pythium oligandrum]|uniref:Uncharacterized protein n=1 Tax=Pythium oligandrum TaxID=41045 RepID=A0A8K1FAD2_PYTOL|nr:hypothetical protein Poli38472_014717 [Pythium oligandrum]|eukprot:TMW54946.1 hypothetical protein Poli38472_014717 [Pythium oligandrum]